MDLPGLDEAPEEDPLRAAALYIDAFMRRPETAQQAIDQLRLHAEALRDRFLPYGIAWRSLALLAGVDKAQVVDFQRELGVARRKKPAEALWDDAGL